jgi:hypothetical protein
MPSKRARKSKNGATKVGGSALMVTGPSVRGRYRSGLCVASLAKGLNPFPPVMRVVLNEVFIGSITAGAAASANFTVLLDSVYEPFNTAKAFPNPIGGSGVTVNPGGFSDLLSSNGPYLNFRVLGAAASWEVLTANAGDNLMYVIAPGDTFGGTHSSASKASQSFGAVSRIQGFGQGGRSMIKGSWSIAGVAGVSESEVLDSSAWQGTYNANPGNIINLDCWYATLDGAVTAGTVTYRVSIAYDVMCNTPAWTANLDDLDTSERNDSPRGWVKPKASSSSSVDEGLSSALSSSSSSSSCLNRAASGAAGSGGTDQGSSSTQSTSSSRAATRAADGRRTSKVVT